MKSILTPKIDQNIGFQVKQITKDFALRNKKKLPNITISREFGCEGFPVAQALEKKLTSSQNDWKIYSRDLLTAISEETDLTEELKGVLSEKQRGRIEQDLEEILHLEPTDFAKYKRLARNFKVITESGGAIVVGTAGAILSRKDEGYLHLRITGSTEFRVNRIANILNLDKEKAREFVEQRGKYRKDFIREFTGQDINNPDHYHLIIRNDIFDAEQIAEMVFQALKMKKLI